jgi:predicted amidohydrolase YtcJ
VEHPGIDGGRGSRGSGDAADLIIAGAIFTGNVDAPLADAMAIRGSSIVRLGTDADVREVIGPGTDVLRVDGLVVPGFQDAHCHPPQSGRIRLRVNLEDGHDLDEYRRIIASYAKAHPHEPWILGGGWSMDVFPGGTPRKEALDAMVPDRPVFLMNRDVHGAWVNTRALEVAGITRDTPDPWDGMIERDPITREPTGTLHEGAAYSFTRHLPPVGQDEWEAAILEAQAYLHSFGITGWQDAWVLPETLRAYRSLAERGALTARVVASLWWDRHRGPEQVADFVDQREWGSHGPLRAISVKIMADGVPENHTAAMLEPYFDADGRPTDNSGMSFLEREALLEAVELLDRERFQVHVHAIGDRAVRDALDAVESAQRANGRRDARHHIAHLQVIHPDDVPRFAQLGVIANVQPLWACSEPQMDELTIPFLGPERASWQYRFGDLDRSGATLAFGSDWAVSSPNPLLEMEVAVTRVDPGERTNEPFLPGQRIDLETAVTAFTMGSVTVNQNEGIVGSIEVGKEADLVVLDRDIFDRATGPIGDARVEMTMVGGRVVYERPR